MIKTFWRAETAIFLGSWLLLMVAGRDGFLRDPGTLWHPVVGQCILDSGTLLATDPFSCTRGGEPWIAKDWLAECAMALLVRVGDLDALLLTLVTMLACLYTWVAYRLMREGLNWMLAVPVVALTILASIYHFHPRPHIVTIVLLGWTFAQLIDFEAGRVPLRRLFWLVPVFVVWTNLHPGVLAGLGTLGLAVAGWGLARLFGATSPVVTFRRFVVLCLLVLACGLTTLVNPYGWQLLHIWLYLSGSKVLPQYMLEHMPLDPWQGGDREVVLMAVFYVTALLGVWPRRPRVSWLIPLVWLALACKSIRHGPLFSITAALALADLLPHTRWLAWIARHSDYLFVPPSGSATDTSRSADRQTKRPPLGAWFALPAGLFVAALGLQAAAVPVPLVGHGWARLNPDYWPVQMLPELREYVEECQRSQPPREPCIFNDMRFGGFLIRCVPGMKVFMDDRCELYGDEFLEAFCQIGTSGNPQLNRWLDEYHINIALVGPDWEVVRYFDSADARADGWKLVQETKDARLYRRNASMPRSGHVQ